MCGLRKPWKLEIEDWELKRFIKGIVWMDGWMDGVGVV